jgi:hypothetical protein
VQQQLHGVRRRGAGDSGTRLRLCERGARLRAGVRLDVRSDGIHGSVLVVSRVHGRDERAHADAAADAAAANNAADARHSAYAGTCVRMRVSRAVQRQLSRVLGSQFDAECYSEDVHVHGGFHTVCRNVSAARVCEHTQSVRQQLHESGLRHVGVHAAADVAADAAVADACHECWYGRCEHCADAITDG